MVKLISFHDELSPQGLHKSYRELCLYADDVAREGVHRNFEVGLSVSSNGGAALAAKSCYEKMWALGSEFSIIYYAKIYHAASAACIFPLLANFENREMSQSGTFAFHLGEKCIQNMDLLAPNGIARSQAEAKEFSEFYFGLIARLNLSIELMSKLHAKGKLVLTAKQCLELGIVCRLF